MSPNAALFSYPFVPLCLMALFGFGNIAVFYGLHPYVMSMGISPFWTGWILALEPLAAFVLCPFISPRLGPCNALPVMRASLVMIALALFSYAWAQSLPALICLRVFHGAAFVSLVSATTALLVHFTPPSRSPLTSGNLSHAADLVRAAVRHIDDMRTTAGYRRQVAGSLVLRLEAHRP